MGLMDVIRRAEERSKQAARRGMDAARHGWEDTERRVRRGWRVHPGGQSANLKNRMPGQAEQRNMGPINSVQPSPQGNVAAHDGQTVPRNDEPRRTAREFEDANRKAIVSINGKDV